MKIIIAEAFGPNAGTARFSGTVESLHSEFISDGAVVVMLCSGKLQPLDILGLAQEMTSFALGLPEAADALVIMNDQDEAGNHFDWLRLRGQEVRLIRDQRTGNHFFQPLEDG